MSYFNKSLILLYFLMSVSMGFMQLEVSFAREECHDAFERADDKCWKEYAACFDAAKSAAFAETGVPDKNVEKDPKVKACFSTLRVCRNSAEDKYLICKFGAR